MRGIYQDGPWVPSEYVLSFAASYLSHEIPSVILRTLSRQVEFEHADGTRELINYEDIPQI